MLCVFFAKWTTLFGYLSFVSSRNPGADLKFLDSWRVISVDLYRCRRLLLHGGVAMILRASHQRIIHALPDPIIDHFRWFHRTQCRCPSWYSCRFDMLVPSRFCWLSCRGGYIGFCSLFILCMTLSLSPLVDCFALHLDSSCTEGPRLFWDVLLQLLWSIASTLSSLLWCHILCTFSDKFAPSYLIYVMLGLLKWIARESVDLVSLFRYLLIVFHEESAHSTWCCGLLSAIRPLSGHWQTYLPPSHRVENPRCRGAQPFVPLLRRTILRWLGAFEVQI